MRRGAGYRLWRLEAEQPEDGEIARRPYWSVSRCRATWMRSSAASSKLPGVPLAANIPGGDILKLRNLWDHFWLSCA
jgi:hypothetical protein